MDSWAVDLKDVAAVYPWQGAEVVMVIVAVAAWIVWHVVQFRAEKREYEEDMAKYATPDAIRKSLDTHY